MRPQQELSHVVVPLRRIPSWAAQRSLVLCPVMEQELLAFLRQKDGFLQSNPKDGGSINTRAVQKLLVSQGNRDFWQVCA